MSVLMRPLWFSLNLIFPHISPNERCPEFGDLCEKMCFRHVCPVTVVRINMLIRAVWSSFRSFTEAIFDLKVSKGHLSKTDQTVRLRRLIWVKYSKQFWRSNPFLSGEPHKGIWQTVQTLIRSHILRRLIRVSTVCKYFCYIFLGISKSHSRIYLKLKLAPSNL